MKKKANKFTVGVVAASVLVLGILVGLLLLKMKSFQNGYLEWEQGEAQRFCLFFQAEILLCGLVLAAGVWVCAFFYRKEALKTLQKEEELAAKELEMEEREQIIADRYLDMDEAEREMARREDEVVEKEKEIAEKERGAVEKEREITEKEQKITEKEREIAEKEQKITEIEREIAEKEQKITEKERKITENEQNATEEMQEIKPEGQRRGELHKKSEVALGEELENFRDEKLGIYNLKFSQSLLSRLDARKVTDVHVAILKARIVKKEGNFGWKDIAKVIERKLEEDQTIARISPKHIGIICIKRKRRVFEAKVKWILRETEAELKSAELRLSMTLCSKLTEDESIVEIVKEEIGRKQGA